MYYTKGSKRDNPYVSINTFIQPQKGLVIQKQEVEPTESKTVTAGKDTDAVNTDLLTDDLALLAGAAYGEGSTKDVYEEMAGIALVLKRQRDARGYKTYSDFFTKEKTFAFAVSDGNKRYAKFIKSTNEQKLADNGMKLAIKAALNADSDGTDYSNGAYFWDGADIKTNYKNHPKVKMGIKFGDTSHNIYGIEESKHSEAPVITYWIDSTGKNTKERGRYEYTYISTAAYGGTIFWKYTDEFLKATGNKQHR